MVGILQESKSGEIRLPDGTQSGDGFAETIGFEELRKQLPG